MTTAAVEIKPKSRAGRPRMDSIRAEIASLRSQISGLGKVDTDQVKGLFQRIAGIEAKLNSYDKELAQKLRDGIMADIDAKYGKGSSTKPLEKKNTEEEDDWL
ncbi:MAG: hypothetical protein HY808_03100 [Nitrospirae bacterium]|nr:hypothetical protein [Nitrospirota bacterium]